MPKSSTILAATAAALTAAVAVSWKMGNLWTLCGGGGGGAAAANSNECPASDDGSRLQNSAFVFVKPHANTAPTQALVRTKLQAAGLEILSETDVTGEDIDAKKLIDQHYYAIASKATILPAADIPVPVEKFREAFHEDWATVVAEGRACNAMEACAAFGCDATELDAAWNKAKNVVKFGGGFYCGLVEKNNKALYVFNAFFMTMREKFVGAGTSIHCYEVAWDPAVLSWSDFRGTLLGPTDPADGPAGSIRNTILATWKELGLTAAPNKGDNGVHASASPFEGLAEKTNWLGASLADDAFGQALLAAGLTEETLTAWSVDPRVHLPGGDDDGKMGSLFDALEDTNADECLQKLVEINAMN